MARRKKQEQENHERWLISYADFITLLFAFFVVMYATSQSDNEKQATFEKSFKQATGTFQSGGAGGILNDPFPTHLEDGSPIESPIRLFRDKNASRKELKDAIWQLIHAKMTAEEIKNSGLDIYDDSQGVRVAIKASRLFPSGSAKILPEALKRLDNIGEVLKLAERRMIIEGHTDDETIASEMFPSNWELAAARASTIVRYLIKRHRVPADLISVASYADQKPLVRNDSAENRAQNRRIEILITTL